MDIISIKGIDLHGIIHRGYEKHDRHVCVVRCRSIGWDLN